MAEAVNKQDIVKGDPLKEIAKDADVLYESLKKVDGEIRKTAQAFTDLSKVEKTTLEGISKINQANETANKLYKQTIENEKTEQKLLREREKLKKQQERERLQEIRLQQQREKAFDKYEKQLQREKKLIADQNNSYRQLTARVNEAQAEFKQLAAQYGLTDKRTIEAHKRFVQIDNDLRKINNAARDGRRDVGRYGLALEKVKGSFGRIAGTLGVAFGATAIVGEIRELNTLANEAQGVEFAFQRIGVEAQSAFDRIKTSTRGLLSDLDIKKSIVEFDNFNLSLEQSDTLFEFLSVRAAQTGKSVDSLRDSLVEGLSKESKLRIDNLGISAMELNAELEKTPNFIDAVANIAKREVEEAGSILDDAASSQEKWNAALQNTRLEIAKKLKPTLDDLFETGANLLKWFATNLETILSVVGKLTKAFISFKVAMFALKMKDRITEWIDYRKAVGNAADGLDETSKSAKSFGKALKGIGWAAAIALAYEFVTALKDVVTGAHQAEEALKALEERQTKGLAEANDKIEGSQNRLRTELKRYKKQLDENKISQSQYNKLVDQAEKDHQIRLEKGIELEIKRREAAGKALEKIQELRKENGEFISDAMDFSDSFNESLFGIEGVESFLDAETKLGAIIDASGTIINRYKEGIKETVQLTDDLVKSTKDLGDVAEETAKGINRLTENQVQAMIDFDDSQDDSNEKFQKRKQEELDILERSFIQRQTALTEARRKEELTEEEYNEQQLIAEIDYLIERLEIRRKYGDDTLELEKELAEKRLALSQSLKKEDAKTEEDLLKERYDTIIGFEEAITQALMDQIDKRIELSKKEQDAAKNAQDYLQQLAANGNIKAEQSIAAEIQIQKDAIAEQERLEKRKAQLELISSGLQTYSAEIGNGKSAAEAFTSTITSTKLLADFLKNLSFFAEGTDNAPGGFAVVDEEGAEIITDKHDKIKQIGTNKGARLTKLDAGDKVITAPKTLELMSAMNIPSTKLNSDSMGNSFDLLRIEKGLKSVENAVKNNATRYNVHWDSFGNVIETRRKGGDRRTSRHRI